MVDYYPAELKKYSNNVWRVEFYVLDPSINKLKIFKRRVRPISNTRDRERFGKRLAAEINIKLARGWNPITEQEAGRSFAILEDVFNDYLLNLKKQLSDGSIRGDTVRSYSSYVNNLRSWIIQNFGDSVYCFKFNRKLLAGFLDHIYFERNNSPRTYNNYLAFINVFSGYLIQRDYINVNPAKAFTKKRNQQKKRKPIPEEIRREIEAYLKENKIGMLTIVELMYYQLVRPTEITKLRVEDINISKGFIRLRPEVTKNRREGQITILKGFVPTITKHIAGAEAKDFLFSKAGFLPGRDPITPKMLSAQWQKIRLALSLDPCYQMYSLKDTGIENMLKAGIPSIKVRDHARHSELATTEKYTQRNNAEDLNNHAKDFSF